MKAFILFTSLVIILLIKLSMLYNKIDNLTYENAKLHIMVDNIVNYADSTADTGEFDEFIASPQGERFFDIYNKLYDK